MPRTVAECQAAFRAADTEREELAGKSDITAEDVTRIEALVGEMGEARAELETARRLEAANGRAADHQGWAGQTQTSVPLPGRNLTGAPTAGTYGNGVSVLDMRPAGTFEMEETARRIEGHFSTDRRSDYAFRAGDARPFEAAREPGYHTAFEKMVRYGLGGWGRLTGTEQAQLQEGLDTEGGFLVPDQIQNQVIQRKPTPTRVQGRVTQITIARDAVSYPKVNYSTDDLYTSGMRITWTGEVPASSTGHRATRPIFGQLRIPVYTAMMSIAVTQDLLEDSMFDLMGWLTGKFGETVELLRDNMILNGTGVSQPTGILANPGGTNRPGTVITGHATELTGDGLINLTEALPEQYDENATLVFNKTNTGRQIRLLKDGDGRPLVSYGAADFGLASGRYREVNGYPYLWSGFMPNVGAAAHPIVFGDLLGYVLVNRVGFSVRVLDQIEAQSNQIVLLARVRFGGDVAEEWRLRAQVVSA